MAERKCQGWERWVVQHCPFSGSLRTQEPRSSPPSASDSSFSVFQHNCSWQTSPLLLNGLPVFGCNSLYSSTLCFLYGLLKGWLFFFFLVLGCVSWTRHKPATCSGLTALSPCDKLREPGFKVKAVLREEGGNIQKLNQASLQNTSPAVSADSHSCSQRQDRSTARKERFCRTTQVYCCSSILASYRETPAKLLETVAPGKYYMNLYCIMRTLAALNYTSPSLPQYNEGYRCCIYKSRKKHGFKVESDSQKPKNRLQTRSQRWRSWTVRTSEFWCCL